MVRAMAAGDNGMPLINATLLVLAMGLTGCASGPKKGPMDDTFSNMSTDEHIEMCKKIDRDAKVACRESVLLDEASSSSFKCLSARMKLDRYCIIVK
jgi:hypothetical protein